MGTSGLGALLVDEGLLTEKDRRTIRGSCGHEGSAFAKSVVALGLLSEDELAAFLAEKTPHRIAAKDISTETSNAAIGTLDQPLIERLEVVPLKLEGRTLTVAMIDPLDRDTVRQLEFFSGYKIAPVIATYSQIRVGLAKLMKNVPLRGSHLEEFLGNHAVSATRRLATLEGIKMPAKKSLVPKDRKEVPTASSPTVSANSVTYIEDEGDDGDDGDDGLEYPGAKTDKSSSQSMSDEIDDNLGDASLGDDSLESVASSALDNEDTKEESLGAGKADLAALEGLDDLEGLDGLEGLDAIDEFGGDDEKNAPKDAAVTTAAAADAVDELQELSGDPTGDDFSDIGDDIFAGDEETSADKSSAETAATDATKNISSKLSDDLNLEIKDASGSLEDLSDDLGIDLGGELSSELDNDSTPKDDDLSALSGDDLSALSGDDALSDDALSDDALSDDALSDDALSGSITDNNDDTLSDDIFGENSTTQPASAPPVAEAPGDLSDLEDPFAVLDDDTSVSSSLDATAALDAGDAEKLAASSLDFTSEDASEVSDDVFAEAVAAGDELELNANDSLLASKTEEETDLPSNSSANDLMQVVAAVNGALLKMTMAKDGPAAASQAVRALTLAGMTQGMLFYLQDKKLTPFGSWQADGNFLAPDETMTAFVNHGLSQAFERLADAWQGLSESSRELDLKPFASWLDQDTSLMAAAVRGKNAAHKLAVVTVWKKSQATDQTVRTCTMELLKQLGRRI